MANPPVINSTSSLKQSALSKIGHIIEDAGHALEKLAGEAETEIKSAEGAIAKHIEPNPLAVSARAENVAKAATHTAASTIAAASTSSV